MAATWKVEITVRDWAARTAMVTGTRTDGLDVRTYTIETRAGSPAASEKQRIYGDLRALYLADKANQDRIAAAIGTWSADIAGLLNAAEV